MRSGGKEQDQVDQEAVVMAYNIEQAEEDARQADNKVRKKYRIIFSTKLRIIKYAIKILFLLMKKNNLKSKLADTKAEV